jgi:hypothetical protein
MRTIDGQVVCCAGPADRVLQAGEAPDEDGSAATASAL